MQQIKGTTTSSQWCYIPTKENLADGASKGLNAVQVNSNDWMIAGLTAHFFCGRMSNFD